MDRWAGGGAVGGRMEAAQLLDIAEKLLDAQDLVGSKKFAERAMESDPLLDGAERVLAAADVLLSAQRRRVNNHVDWYALLQLDPPSDAGRCDISAVRLHYRRLALLLRPDLRPYSAPADEALKLVSDAWAVLSDPSKRELYDQELAIAAAQQHPRPNGGSHHHGAGEKPSVDAEGNADASFWTACTNCFHIHQYARGCEDRTLVCQNCRKLFPAVELESPPPIVPGSDMYFCSWGLFPLGFPGGPNFGFPGVPSFANGPDVGHDPAGKPWGQSFFPGYPSWWGEHAPSATDRRGGWVNADGRSAYGSGGRKHKQSNAGEMGNPGMEQDQSFWAANKGKPHGKAMDGNVQCDEVTRTPLTSGNPPKETRKKVMAKRPKKQVAGVVDFGIAAPRAAHLAVNPPSKNDANIRVGVVTRPDGGHNPHNVGCSRTVEISSEDLDLNFSIDIDATDNILHSLSTLPFLKDGEIVVVD